MWEEGIHIYGTPGVHNNFSTICTVDIMFDYLFNIKLKGYDWIVGLKNSTLGISKCMLLD